MGATHFLTRGLAQVNTEKNLHVGGLDMERLRRDMSNPESARIAEQDMADAKAVKVMQTPTFYINGKPLTEYGFEQLRTRVKQEIAAQYR